MFTDNQSSTDDESVHQPSAAVRPDDGRLLKLTAPLSSPAVPATHLAMLIIVLLDDTTASIQSLAKGSHVLRLIQAADKSSTVSSNQQSVLLRHPLLAILAASTEVLVKGNVSLWNWYVYLIFVHDRQVYLCEFSPVYCRMRISWAVCVAGSWPHSPILHLSLTAPPKPSGRCRIYNSSGRAHSSRATSTCFYTDSSSFFRSVQLFHAYNASIAIYSSSRIIVPVLCVCQAFRV